MLVSLLINVMLKGNLSADFITIRSLTHKCMKWSSQMVTILEYSANVIAENMWAQCDLDGQERLLMQAIVDHRKDGNDAVPYTDRFVYPMVNPDSTLPLLVGSSAFSGRMGLLAGRDSQI
jgi:hypothetical protein